MKTRGQSLDDESLITLMTEVEGILNSRPLTVETIYGPTSFQPLSPINLLTMKSKLMFIARDARDTYNILPTNFDLIGEKNIYSHFKNVKNEQEEEETLG